MASVTLENVTVRYPDAPGPALDGLDLHAADGQFVVITGPPRAGKSTLLRVLAGQEDPTSGRVLIGGVDVTAVPAQGRDAVLVFQNYALYPHMSVRDNMSFALRVAGVPEAEREERVSEAARLLDLTDRLDLGPDRLTGPQRQQVALARAVVRRPAVLLMDDPLAMVSPELRDHTADLIRSLVRNLRVTTLQATADPGPLASAADRVLRLDGGRLMEDTADTGVVPA
ncbi:MULTISPECIES: ABC transporter ATP-binding protein [Micrococcaceae]|uniref:ABC transporter ATP-binding protein n=1 Tax=Micrococcaceae TaxID=1268 RepID=UPI001619BE3D|nr:MULTISPECIES: ABC transporter ATP-binding protein [Micrococcaceae]MBB5747806.1 ABC-type sugar transport system ATPase subunit [Micrococcus sp. TA1]HRO30526.1 ABC transporter ATP-binding protein [Citricoccus sp.]HRO93858.1 ABC transporter ATP-binding protein [Citricoccus sp.]